jgi:5,10-methylene-tetrahydrofolate dehydrogenase/methenyl tetrahydrofolate cyclohydrolase
MDGKACSNAIISEIQQQVKELKSTYNEVPGLAVLQVGGRPDSTKYVQMKKETVKLCGMADYSHNFPEEMTQEALLNVISYLNEHPRVHGILVQLPLPRHISQATVTQAIRPDKDVDGFHAENIGRMALAKLSGPTTPWVRSSSYSGLGDDYNAPCTPKGCIELLDRCGVEISGKHAVVLGRSNIVGLPAANMLLNRDATVMICHSKTPDLKSIVSQADILVAAIGRGRMVKGDWVKRNAVVLDVGVNFEPNPHRDNKVTMCGDVDFEEVREVAAAITPVPGGVGPLTVSMLMKNTADNAQRYCERYYRAPWFVGAS